MTRSRLSDQPSKLVLQTIKDVKTTEIASKKTDKFRIDMDIFFEKTLPLGKEHKVCTVCAAGAVAMCRIPNVRKLLTNGETVEFHQTFFNALTDKEKRKIYAIDSFRQGLVDAGLVDLLNALPVNSKWYKKIFSARIDDKNEWAIDVPPYDPNDSKPWFTGMRKVARHLEDIGL